MSKIGIMGGTYDPIHLGHMQLAEQALTEQKLDKIIFVPNHVPWMKKERHITEENHRLEMVRLAIEDHPDYELSLVEIEAGGNSYTYQTLETLKKQRPEDLFYLILGADSLLSIEKWAYPEKIMKNAAILAAVRDDCDMRELSLQKEKLVKQYDARIFLLHMTPVHISSTVIRNAFYKEPEIAKMLPEKVAEYIRQNHLYTSEGKIAEF